MYGIFSYTSIINIHQMQVKDLFFLSSFLARSVFGHLQMSIKKSTKIRPHKGVIFPQVPRLPRPLKNSNELRKEPSYFPLYWWVKKGTLYWLIKVPIYWVVYSPIQRKQPGFFSLLKCMVYLDTYTWTLSWWINGATNTPITFRVYRRYGGHHHRSFIIWAFKTCVNFHHSGCCNRDPYNGLVQSPPNWVV